MSQRILILGGTQFVGRHLAQACLDRGHQLTLFHRGKTQRGLFPEAREVLGDRDGGLDVLGTDSYDWVIDTCGYTPRVVGESARRFADLAQRYLFISTVSVYEDFSSPGLVETDAVAEIDDPETETVDARTYGALKALCEDRVLEFFSGRALIPRPGIIAGPYDPTDRFPYWVDRAASGAAFEVPADSDQPMQLIDARDLAQWCADRVEAGTTGVFNTAGKRDAETFGSMIRACCEGTGGAGKPQAVDSKTLLDRGVRPGQDLPLWLPDPEKMPLFQVDSGRAEALGLRHRPLVEVARDTWDWLQTLPADREWKVGLRP